VTIETDDPGRRSGAAHPAGILLVIAFLVATLGPVLLGLDHFPSKSIDMDRNHVPVIRTFAAEWPSPHLDDYDSATTPGMHLALAALSRITGDSETVLQSATCVFGAGLVWIAWLFASRVAGPWPALACTLPLAASPYVLGNAIWVMTDDLALALAAITMGVAIFTRPTVATSAISGIAMVLSVLVRQINVWPTAVAWLATVLGRPAMRRRLPFRDRTDSDAGITPAIVLGVGVCAAFAVLGSFIARWNGLVPPMFQPGGGGAATHAGGLNVAVTPYTLTLLGVYALPAVIVLLPFWREDASSRHRAVIGASLGLATGLLLESAPGIEVGRNGGWLWTLADRLPVVAGRSTVLVAGATLGGLAAGSMFGLARSAGRERAAWLMLGFGVSFLAAYTANAQAFQRYFDPPVLLAIGWGLATAARARTEAGPIRNGRLGFAAVGVAAMQMVFAVATLYLPLLRHGTVD
jgi:hypothetical protein